MIADAVEDTLGEVSTGATALLLTLNAVWTPYLSPSFLYGSPTLRYSTTIGALYTTVT